MTERLGPENQEEQFPLPPEMSEHTCYQLSIPREEPMKHAPFAVGQRVSIAVSWQMDPVEGRIVSVDNDAPLGLCYAVERSPGDVWHFSSLHMEAVA